MKLIRRRVQTYLPAIILFISALVGWELAVRTFDIKGFILPSPSAVANAFSEQWPELLTAGRGTFLSALAGLGLGAFMAILVAMSASRWESVREGVMPLAIAANSTPIVVLAPVANSWFGLLSPWSSIVVVAVLVFFPIMINLVRGLLSTHPNQLELMDSYASPGSKTLWSVRMPGALPHLFSAFKVAAPLSLIGAIVKEYFGGSQERLGQYITLKAGLFQFEEAWAAIVLASAFGIALYLSISWIERKVIPWHASMRSA